MGCCCSRKETDPQHFDQNSILPDKKEERKWKLCCNKSRRKRRQQDERTLDEDSASSSRAEPNVTPDHKTSTKYVALWKYTKCSKAELSFREGDTFRELGDACDAGPDWIFVTKEGGRGGGTGYIPANYVAKVGTIQTEKYYFGELGHDEAETILLWQSDGTFLLRKRKQSAEFQDAMYALGVAFDNGVKHYKIFEERKGEDMRYFLGKKKFANLCDMVRWYQHTRDGGICCLLTAPPPRYPPPKPVLPAEVEKHWQEIPRSQITIICTVGKGYFGVVSRGWWHPTERVKLQVAVKELKRGALGSREEFLAEAVAMKNLVHENLVKLIGVVSASEPYWIVTEYIRDGSVKSFLQRRAREHHFLHEPQLVAIARDVACGMAYLEQKKVVHRDLAARNVLIQSRMQWEQSIKEPELEKFEVKIADFGLAQMVKEGALQETRSVSVATKWTAPEALADCLFSSASDVWSFGIVLHEIFTHGEDPYAGMTTAETRKFVLEEKKRLQRSLYVPEKIYMLIGTCLVHECEARPTFSLLLRCLDKYYAKEEMYDPYGFGRVHSEEELSS